MAFPPLPAVLLLPLVAIFHLSYSAIISLVFSVGMGILNIWLMLEVLKRFSQWQSAKLRFEAIAWFVALFALGTEHLYATMQGDVWFTAHIVATTFLLLYIGETLHKRRPFVAGLYLGLAALSRSTTLFTFPFFVLLTISAFLASRKEGMRRTQCLPWKELFSFFAVLGVFIAGMLIYNLARFGSLFDFGYSTMKVNIFISGNLHTYGQFNPHFILTNLRYMLLEPPNLVPHLPYLSFSPLGTGIFWTTPALGISAQRASLAGSSTSLCLPLAHGFPADVFQYGLVPVWLPLHSRFSPFCLVAGSFRNASDSWVAREVADCSFGGYEHLGICGVYFFSSISKENMGMPDAQIASGIPTCYINSDCCAILPRSPRGACLRSLWTGWFE